MALGMHLSQVESLPLRKDKLGYIKIKSLHSSSNTTIKIKMPGTNWEIFITQKVNGILNRVPTNQFKKETSYT